MEKSSFFDSVNVGGVWDRPWRAPNFASYFASFIGNGVFPNPSNNLQVIANDDMTVTVKAGKGWINGYYYENTDDLILSIDVADGVLDRIDTVVLQYRGLVDDGRKIVVQIKKGDYKSDPVAQSLQRDSDIYELKLADIIINHGAIKITQADITDTRLDKSVCGVVSQMVQTVDTTTLFNQYKSWYEQTTGKAIKDITAFEVQFKTDTIAWLNGLKEVLDKNTAANLLNLINELKSTTYTKSQTDTLIASRTGVNASASRPWGDNPEIVLIDDVSVGVTHITFVAPIDFKQSDVYCILYPNASNAWNDKIQLALTDLAGEPLDDGIWKTGAPVSLIIQGDKAFFKGGGGSVNDTLPFLASFKATAKNGLVHLDLSAENNQLPVFLGTTLVRKIGSAPVNFRDGIKIEIGGAGSYDDTNVENGVTYYYRAFLYNSKKQHQTTILNAVVSATPKAFSLPTFTGQHTIFGDETKGRIEMYSSGTLTLSETVYDLFAVGGGGGGGYGGSIGGGGGGGGYTSTALNSQLTRNNYSVVIGVGGISSGDGGDTEIQSVISAQGGRGGRSGGSGTGGGGSGGSGGGGGGGEKFGGGNGGSNGGSGINGGGNGQGKTTRAFEIIEGVLYSGGGGGGEGKNYNSGGIGGDGGGGNGGDESSRGNKGDAGSPNTGGGGGGGCYVDGGIGGSGIAIVRWGY